MNINDLNNMKLTVLPECWNDEVRMNFLFSVFRLKSVNPEGWTDKMNFWFNTITDLCHQNKNCVINDVTLKSAFRRNGREPQCLDAVLEHMAEHGTIMDIGEFSKIGEQGWLGWGINLLIQKPITWGFSTVQSFLKWGKRDERFIVVHIVKDFARKLFQRYNDLVAAEAIDNSIFFENFEEKCRDICTGINFRLALVQLQKEKKAYVFNDSGKEIIKFRKPMEDNVKPLSDVDKGVLKLQKAKEFTLNEIEKLEREMESLKKEAKALIGQGNKTSAMAALKKKKRLDSLLEKKTIAFDNLDSLQCQLQNSGSEKLVLEAYKAGAQAMKVATKDDLDIDRVDTLLAEMEEVYDNYKEVQDTLAKPVGDGDSLEDYEDELEQLMQETKPATNRLKPQEMEYPKPTRSREIATDEDLMKRLAALRSPPKDSVRKAVQLK